MASYIFSSLLGLKNEIVILTATYFSGIKKISSIYRAMLIRSFFFILIQIFVTHRILVWKIIKYKF